MIQYIIIYKLIGKAHIRLWVIYCTVLYLSSQISNIKSISISNIYHHPIKYIATYMSLKSNGRALYHVLIHHPPYKALAKEVEQYLARVRAAQESVKHEEGLPGELTERLSEANMLLTSLPPQLEERAKYLEDNKRWGIYLI